MIREKHQGKLYRKTFLIGDHTMPHKAALPAWLLSDFDWEVVEHPVYNPDLAPSNYHTFPYVKMWLGRQYFENENALKMAVYEFPQSRRKAGTLRE